MTFAGFGERHLREDRARLARASQHPGRVPLVGVDHALPTGADALHVGQEREGVSSFRGVHGDGDLVLFRALARGGVAPVVVVRTTVVSL